ncbi:polysaccharide deacetylase family protein [Sphingomonas sp. UYP23]
MFDLRFLGVRARAAGLALATVVVAVATPLHAKGVAITVDDLPVYGRFWTAAEGKDVTDRLLAGMQRNHWKATGFVNEIQLDAADRPTRIALLDAWLNAGMDLGNHTYSHPSLTKTPVEAYIADVARDETVTAPLLAARGRRERWFRYPFLETGTTQAVRTRFEGWLTEHGYRVAPVTMENSDWQFATLYDDAVARGDVAAAARVRQEYLIFTRKIVAWYKQAAIGLLGREPSFVFLLHASRLNAASIDALAAIFREAKLRPITLDAAMRDPAYRTADQYVGPDGNEWLERWSQTLHKRLPFETMPSVPKAVVTGDARLEAIPDPHAPAGVVPAHP